LWFPIKSPGAADALCGEVVSGGATEALRITIDVGRDREDRLTVAGLLVINPPFGFAEEMRAAAKFLAPRLGRISGVPAKITISANGAS
jgi:23S rRNA A2030 N6-methylase RlmJ